MLLADWEDLDPEQAAAIEEDNHAWIAQPKLDGVRALFHVEDGQVRITSRCVSEVTYRLSEFQDNLLHLQQGFHAITGTILDGELLCPIGEVNTGNTLTMTPLQATTAILATSPENAKRVQDQHPAHLQFHVFDVLKFAGNDMTQLPLYERQAVLHQALRQIHNPHVHAVDSVVVGKSDFHRRVIESGGEGTVWKKADESYEIGRRANHWIKRKGWSEVEARVTGFKPGQEGQGNQELVGAVEFSVQGPAGALQPIAWVSSWTDVERRAMSKRNDLGEILLDSSLLEKKAVIRGRKLSTRSGRLCHATHRRWLEQPT